MNASTPKYGHYIYNSPRSLASVCCCAQLCTCTLGSYVAGSTLAAPQPHSTNGTRTSFHGLLMTAVQSQAANGLHSRLHDESTAITQGTGCEATSPLHNRTACCASALNETYHLQ